MNWRKSRSVTTLGSSVQGIVYKFESFAALSQALDTEEPDVKLPVEDGLVDGQWLVATFTIGNDATSVAGRVADRGSELHLTFEERDWNQLCRFANGECSPSIPPPCREGAEEVSAPPGSTVLVVDDDPCMRSIVCTMLHSAHIKTLQVGSAGRSIGLAGQKQGRLGAARLGPAGYEWPRIVPTPA